MKLQTKAVVVGLLLGAFALLTAGVRNGLPYHKTAKVQTVVGAAPAFITPAKRASYGDFYITATTAGLCTLSFVHANLDSSVVILTVPTGGIVRLPWYGPRFDKVRIGAAANVLVTGIVWTD